MQTTLNETETLVNCCCSVDCSYNQSGICFASEVAIGDARLPTCETFKKSRSSTKFKAVAKVRICNQVSCAYNQDNICQAKEIRMGIYKGKPFCSVYTPRSW